MLFTHKPSAMPASSEALPGRPEPISGLGPHRVLGTPTTPPFPKGTERAILGVGCFWGADRPF